MYQIYPHWPRLRDALAAMSQLARMQQRRCLERLTANPIHPIDPARARVGFAASAFRSHRAAGVTAKGQKTTSAVNRSFCSAATQTPTTANEIRELAQRVTSPEIRAELLPLAERYERLAARAEARKAGR
jgi:hypothetical protein